MFHCKRTVARVNNPRNAHVLKKLGVDIARQQHPTTLCGFWSGRWRPPPSAIC
ncbi:MAG: hypothetical protein ACLU9S_04035 [Oscillospiraceae bacterium]